MAKILSNPIKISVVAAGTSNLSKLAASMTPGSWAQMNSANQDVILGVGSISGSMIHYCNSMPWNPIRKCIEIVGMDHNAGIQRYVRFDPTSNGFVLVTADTGTQGTRHGYDHNTVNPFNGDLYHRPAENNYERPGILVRKWANSANSFSDTMPLANTLFYMQNAIGVTWWSGPFSGAGAQGCMLLYNSGDSAKMGAATDGGMYAYDPLANKWFWSSQSMSPFYGTAGNTYHSVLEYSEKKNVAIYGGGNDQPHKLWRLNSDRTFVAMPDVPSGKGVGIQQGNLVCDPVTGNFLLLSANELWELDPTGTGTWTQQKGSRVPPSGVGTPGPTTIDGMISSAIADYGVIAYIKQTSSTGGSFYLYKHA